MLETIKIPGSERRIQKMVQAPMPEDLRTQYQAVRKELSERRALEFLRLALRELRSGEGFNLPSHLRPEEVAGTKRFWHSSRGGPTGDFAGPMIIFPDAGPQVAILEFEWREALRAEAALDAQAFNLRPFEDRRAAIEKFTNEGIPHQIGTSHAMMSVLEVDRVGAVLRVKP